MFDLDYRVFKREFYNWLSEHELTRVPRSKWIQKLKSGKNMMADEVMGVYYTPNGGAEISTGVFMNHRTIGVTWNKEGSEFGGCVQSFTELNELLGL